MEKEKNISMPLNILLWTSQVFVAAVLLFSAYIKIFQPEGFIIPWIEDNPGFGMFMGMVDIAGGVGILFPALFKVRPKLSTYAAIGVILLMFSAIIFHLIRGEGNSIGINIILLLLSVFIAFGRQKKVPILAQEI